MASSTTSSPFTKAVVSAIRNVYPEHLADHSFDNTGLLLEAPFDKQRQPQKNTVLLTNDLTTAVADEAIERKDSVVVAYHPIIFRGLKSLTLEDTQQRSLLRLAGAGISVYCPHTAVDSIEGGNADWLGDIVTGEIKKDYKPAPPSDTAPTVAQGYKLQHFPSSHDAQHDSITLASLPHDRNPISGLSQPDGKHKNAGVGRHIKLHTPRPLSEILTTMTTYWGNPPSMMVATPQGTSDPGSQYITSIAICAGSGGSVFSKLKEPVDLLLTGELTHHEALAAIEQGKSVICVNHSNSERAYLGAVMKGLLKAEIEKVWREARKGNEGKEQMGYEDESVDVEVSRADRDPFGYVVRSV